MRRVVLSGFGLLIGFAATVQAESVIVKCARPCAAVIQAIERNGGSVTYRYKYVDAIAAEVNDAGLRAVRAVVQPGSIRKDIVVSLPSTDASSRGTVGAFEATADSAGLLSDGDVAALATANPDAYLLNNVSLGL